MWCPSLSALYVLRIVPLVLALLLRCNTALYVNVVLVHHYLSQKHGQDGFRETRQFVARQPTLNEWLKEVLQTERK
jgi:hypothetical protein